MPKTSFENQYKPRLQRFRIDLQRLFFRSSNMRNMPDVHKWNYWKKMCRKNRWNESFGLRTMHFNRQKMCFWGYRTWNVCWSMIVQSCYLFLWITERRFRMGLSFSSHISSEIKFIPRFFWSIDKIFESFFPKFITFCIRLSKYLNDVWFINSADYFL